MTAARTVVGWDVGGAHLKACLLQDGQVLDVQQWACPLWQGLQHLDAAVAQAEQRWPALHGAWHAVTMTGEMVDYFANREAGVRAIAERLVQLLERPLHGPHTARREEIPALCFYAGANGWCGALEAGERWAQLASANWRATASHVAAWAAWAADAAAAPRGVLIDIGSTTTDLIAFAGKSAPSSHGVGTVEGHVLGRVLSNSHSDAQRLASGELVYQGVVRTPLCALAQRVALAGTRYNVMNEFFATTADVYRLIDELDATHDLHAAADGAGKSTAATQQRLARMVGLDAADASAADWLAFAQQWRAAQVAELAGQLRAVCGAHGLPADAPVVAAGCGAFLAPDVCAAAGLRLGAPVLDYGRDVAPHQPAGRCRRGFARPRVCTQRGGGRAVAPPFAAAGTC